MNHETRDILKAWGAISLAFAIVLSGGLSLGLPLFTTFLTMFLISGFTVGLGFLFHELAHRTLARSYGCNAEFRSFDQMLILAVLMSFLGFVFAAPGAVFIHGRVTRERNGKISAVGPATNIILALAFLGLTFLALPEIVQTMASYGKMINAWLALFNMIPLGNFDGVKILHWDKKVYGLMLAVSALLVFVL